jgi:hypothetical protein
MSETKLAIHTEGPFIDLNIDDSVHMSTLKTEIDLTTHIDVSHEGDIEAAKAAKDALWAEFEEVKTKPELLSLFDRTTTIQDVEPAEMLRANGYPSRSTIDELDMGEWKVNLNPKFMKDGFMYLLRGDNPSQGAKGFYARTYGYGRKNVEEVAREIGTPERVEYVLYSDEHRINDPRVHVSTAAGELAYQQSAKGGSAFISATTSLEAARAGTGNSPNPEEKALQEVYVIKLPVDSVINSNTGNFFGMEEDEYLVPDFILPNEVVARFPRDAKEDIYSYMHELLGVTKEDLRIKSVAA